MKRPVCAAGQPCVSGSFRSRMEAKEPRELVLEVPCLGKSVDTRDRRQANKQAGTRLHYSVL